MENLKEIGGFPGYCVDNTGNVLMVKQKIIMVLYGNDYYRRPRKL